MSVAGQARCALGSLTLGLSVQLAALSLRALGSPLQLERNDAFKWAHFAARLFAVDVRNLAGSLERSPRTLYVCNHRCWADFFLDILVTEGRACALSRRAVFLAFPLLMVPAYLAGGVASFSRNRVGSGSSAVASALDMNRHRGLLVYLEGTRSQSSKPLRLKSGALRIAFRRNLRVQPVITEGKERVLNERTRDAHRHQSVFVVYGNTIDASHFLSEDEQGFVDAVHSAFRTAWSIAYARHGDYPKSIPGDAYASSATATATSTSQPLQPEVSLHRMSHSQVLLFYLVIIGSTAVICASVGAVAALILGQPLRPMKSGCIFAAALSALMQLILRDSYAKQHYSVYPPECHSRRSHVQTKHGSER